MQLEFIILKTFSTIILKILYRLEHSTTTKT